MDVFDLVAKISLDSSEYDAGLDEAGNRASGFAAKIGNGLKTAAKIGSAAIGASAAAAAAFAKGSVDVGAKFDSSMSQVAATMGTSVDEIEVLRDFAQEMGAKTAFSATEAADALNYMALAGYSADQSMEALPNVLNLAAAGGIDLASASDMVTDAQSALGLSMEESAELVDKMAKASSKSNTSVAQLGEAILTIGGTAKNLAGGTTELSTALGILADNGVKGAEGGTALRNIILSLSAPTDTAAAAIKGLGVEVYDAAGNMRPLNEVFGDLDASLSTMTQGEQTEVLNSIFNKVDLKSVNALLANTGERFDELSGYIDNASGSAQAMADTQLDNLNGDITLFKSALEGAQIIISDQLTPDLREFVQFGSSGISDLATSFQEGGLSGAMETFGDILGSALTMIIEKLPSFVEAGARLLGALASGIVENIPVIADSAMQVMTMLATYIIEALPDIAAAAIEIVTSLANGITGALPELIPVAVAAILQLVETLTNPDSIGSMIEAAGALILAIASGLVEAIPQILEKVPVIIGNLVEAFTANFPAIVGMALELIGVLASGLIEAIPTLVTSVPTLIAAIVGGFVDGASDILDIGKNIVKGIWDGIVGMGSWITEKVGGFFGDIVDGVKDTLGIHSPSTVFAGIGENMALGLGEGWEDEFAAVQSKVKNGLDFGTTSIDFQSSGLGAMMAGAGNGAMMGDSGEVVIPITLEMDGEVLARKTYRYNQNESARIGSAMVRV